MTHPGGTERHCSQSLGSDNSRGLNEYVRVTCVKRLKVYLRVQERCGELEWWKHLE